MLCEVSKSFITRLTTALEALTTAQEVVQYTVFLSMIYVTGLLLLLFLKNKEKERHERFRI